MCLLFDFQFSEIVAKLTVLEGLECFKEDLESEGVGEAGTRLLHNDIDHVDLRHFCC